MTITVTADYKKAIFEWNGGVCTVSAFGMEDDEIQHLIDSKENEGCDVDGYEVDF